ncbi:MAG: hypothetical protein ACP5MI_10165 [Candidatus Kryptoniota bacterium]
MINNYKPGTELNRHFNPAYMILFIALFNHYSFAQNTNYPLPNHSSSNLTTVEQVPGLKSSYYHEGLGLVISFMPYYSALSDEAMRNYVLTVGLSYTFNSSLGAEARFYTGEEELTRRDYLPVTGKLLIGAGDIMIQSYLADFRHVRLYAGCGAGLQTILTEQQKGYNGYGVMAYAGGETLASRDISTSIALCYRRCYYTSLVNGGNWSRLNSNFTDDWIGLNVAVNLYFK